MTDKQGHIYSGIGGWNFPPWRGVFYPKGLPQAKELEYAGQHLTAIEINATYYGSQKPESFRKWAASVPDGFKFSVKASRFSTNRRVLREGADSVKRFIGSGRCCGSSRRSRSSTRPTSAAFSSCCRRKPTALSCGTSSRCATTASARPTSSS